MIFTKIKRVSKAGFLNFWRNGWVSITAILVMVITLFTIGSLIFSRVVMGTMLTQIKNRVDISVYFKRSAENLEIDSLKKSLEELSEVQEVVYISAEEALENFKDRHQDNTLIIQSIDELDGENPLGAVINIKAKEVSQYANIAEFLDGESVSVKGADSIIEKVNYFQNKKIIDNLVNILDSTKRLGISISIILALISILVIFNTIGLVIYSSRTEIEVMKLVGASNKFASGPFVVEGAIYGIVSTIITMLIFYPVTLWLGPITENFFGGMDIYSYYISYFGQIFAFLLLVGIGLGTFSSLIAVRRYLKI